MYSDLWSTLLWGRKEVGVGGPGLGADKENDLRIGLPPDTSGGQRLPKKELAWLPGLEVENGHRKVEGSKKEKLKDGKKMPDRSGVIMPA